ncbi:MAG: hypothetical protein A2878_02980 [Candidatus Moranbacteria bacterium RIFCSPHIGHO2_01_FULL_54_31]|nr:MAG: hypothetical protein A2878_02980 [Candidatus Moranbacteria bacterium RIFCSPHIGHO2_01_FULL_54_31]
MIVRRMTVVRAPSTNGKPMIRLINNLLTKAGFEIGTPIEVTYQRGIITIKKLDEHHEYNLQKPRPFTLPGE